MPSLVYVNASSVQKSMTAISFSNESAVLSAAKKIYYGSTLVWTAPATQSWIALASGNAYVVAFTPSVNMTINSFSMTYNIGTNFNVEYGIWTVSGGNATPVANACATNTTGVTITNLGTVVGKTAYKYTKTYTASNPVLVAGTTYYFSISDRYATKNVLSGSNVNTGYLYDWAISATNAITYIVGNLGSFELLITYT